MRQTFILIALILSNSAAIAQLDKRHNLGIATGMVYLSDEKKTAPGLHLEYAYNFNFNQRTLSSNTSVEFIFGDQRHIGLALGIGFSPIKNLDVGIGPGVMFEGDEHYFCLNLSTSYDFDFRRIAIGPILELAHTGKHYHFLLGIQINTAF